MINNFFTVAVICRLWNKLSKQKLLEFLLFSIGLKDDLTLVGGVNVVLHESIKSEIDLNSTNLLFKRIGR